MITMKKPIFILAVLSVIFLVMYFWLITPIPVDVSVGQRFDWPDEAANYYWTVYYAQTGQLSLGEPLNIAALNQIHPRSFNVLDNGDLVPGSFLGLILFFGTLAKIFGVKAIIYFTPLFSVAGAWAFYGIIKKIFNERLALICAVLLLFNPAWWYYSVTSMLPNVTFVSCILISIYFILACKEKQISPLIASGLFLGLATSIRPSEFIWLTIVYLVVIVYQKNKFSLLKVFLFLAVAALMIAPSLYQQSLLYGGFLNSGYSQLQQDSSASTCQLCNITKSLILPFGFHPYLAAYNFWVSYFSRFWFLSLLTILGAVVFLSQKREQKNEMFGYILLTIFVFAWLIIYYGSWQFTDLVTLNLNTLGLSYVRYWLPLYLMSLPFVAIALSWLINFLPRRWENIGLIILLLGLFYYSANLVLFANRDSIVPVRDRIAEYKKSAWEIIDSTESDSVIVTVRKDKLFFPERKVIHTFDALFLNEELLLMLPQLVEQAPVYYYALGAEPKTDISPELKLTLVKKVGQEILYKVTKAQ